MKFWMFEDETVPKRLDRKVTFEVPLSIIFYGSFICFGGSLLLSIFLGLFTGGI